MADVVKLGSGVPRVPLRRADDLVARIAALKTDAEARGLGTLAYLLDMARIEAQTQAERIDEEHAPATGRPDEMWRPL